MAEPAGRELPVRALLPEPLGDGHAAAEGVVDRRGAGQEGVALEHAGVVDRPADDAVGTLPAEHEVEAALDARPQLGEQVRVTGDEVVVPGTGRQVGADVGVEPLVLHACTEVVVEPAAVGELAVGHPAVGTHRLVVEPAHRQGHGRFHVVPRVAVATVKPRDHAVGPLGPRDGEAGGHNVGGREDAPDLGDRDRRGADRLVHAAAPSSTVTTSAWVPVSSRRASFSRGFFR